MLYEGCRLTKPCPPGISTQAIFTADDEWLSVARPMVEKVPHLEIIAEIVPEPHAVPSSSSTAGAISRSGAVMNPDRSSALLRLHWIASRFIPPTPEEHLGVPEEELPPALPPQFSPTVAVGHKRLHRRPALARKWDAVAALPTYS